MTIAIKHLPRNVFSHEVTKVTYLSKDTYTCLYSPWLRSILVTRLPR